MTYYSDIYINPDHSYFVTGGHHSFLECPNDIDGLIAELIAMAHLPFIERYTGAQLKNCQWNEPIITSYYVPTVACAVHLAYDLSGGGYIDPAMNNDEQEEDFS